MGHIEERYDVLIAGTGAAGLCCALNLPRTARVLLITKDAADRSDSFLAQGGICMLRGEEDFAAYFEDTMRAGHYENDEAAVKLMIGSSPAMIAELVKDGVDFARDGKGNFRLTREGGHSRPRILFHDDVTGKEITSKLLALAKERGIPHTIEAMGGSTGTNADGIAPAAGGVRTGLLSIPQRYMHTPVEVVRLSDVEAVGERIAAYILRDMAEGEEE